MTTTSTRGAAARGGAARVRSGIDPRIRARRIAVKRTAGRRRLRRLLLVVLLAAIAIGAYGLTRTALLDVDAVEIRGAERTDPAAIQAVAGVDLGDPMLDVDAAAARRRVGELAWVETVSVKRQWPNTVRVEVTEREPLAVVAGADGRTVVVDRTARVLEQVDEPWPDLTRVRFSEAVQAPAGQRQDGLDGALALAGLLTEDLRPWVEAIRAGADGTVAMDLTGDVEVLIGEPARLADKVIDLATVLTRVDLEDLSTIDLRVARTPVLTRDQPPT